MNRVCIGCARTFPSTTTSNRCERCQPKRRTNLGRAHRKRKRETFGANQKCEYCGAPATHLDHRVPVNKGGGNDPANLVAACEPCNLRKADKNETEFRQSGWLERRRELVQIGAI